MTDPYTAKVIDHFSNPRNVGTVENADGTGRVGNPTCGDVMEITIKVENNHLSEVKFRTFGCGAAIATSSMITELARGKTLEEALKITRKDVADELDGLPPQKMHCSNLAADALRNAIRDHWEKNRDDRLREHFPEDELQEHVCIGEKCAVCRKESEEQT